MPDSRFPKNEPSLPIAAWLLGPVHRYTFVWGRASAQRREQATSKNMNLKEIKRKRFIIYLEMQRAYSTESKVQFTWKFEIQREIHFCVTQNYYTGEIWYQFFLCGHNTHVGHSIFTTFKGFYSDSFWRSTWGRIVIYSTLISISGDTSNTSQAKKCYRCGSNSKNNSWKWWFKMVQKKYIISVFYFDLISLENILMVRHSTVV